ncbi:pantoate--beta-alanine ligase [Polycladomyces subterraneus]|uniref:Pantothenate synthetase n=1 Tax=Polycladomyces subterraneus TaxID=1016997 RepID=A0ABT8IKE0_9BACL|nr:pantoate--beta-alanine ligase [Polycladomyces subterraneus]MDN4593256.1 pantoate--beta-alanine ligase [Polycladomyces subterraneus]
MKIIHSIQELRQTLRPLRTGTIGFVPTMGYLHRGHQSLMDRARQDCDTVVVSVFVNPLQFGPNEDFDRYPRDLERDAAIAEAAGVDYLFAPSVDEMYPSKSLTTVTLRRITEPLCGASRPGHFDGVATVVTKLFHIVQPDKAYFGLKDAQQVAVIQQMTEDLNFPVEIVPCPTVREPDGLAMSSRNVYLSPEERQQATVLYRALRAAKEQIEAGTLTRASDVTAFLEKEIRTQPLADIDYVQVLSYPRLERIDRLENERIIMAVAVRFGSTRLIDNLILPEEGDGSCFEQ